MLPEPNHSCSRSLTCSAQNCRSHTTEMPQHNGQNGFVTLCPPQYGVSSLNAHHGNSRHKLCEELSKPSSLSSAHTPQPFPIRRSKQRHRTVVNIPKHSPPRSIRPGTVHRVGIIPIGACLSRIHNHLNTSTSGTAVSFRDPHPTTDQTCRRLRHATNAHRTASP